MSVNSSMTTAPAAGGSGTLALATARECTWAASSGASWVVITSSTSGQGEGEISFRVATNRDPVARQTTIEVNDAKTTISQAQAECSFNVSPRAATIGQQGGTLPIDVEPSANCAWSASSQADWVRIGSGGSGTGNGTVVLAVDANPGSERSAAVTIAGLTVAVTQVTSVAPPTPPAQPNCSYAIQPAGQAMASAGGTGTIAVSASAACSWTAASNAPWITITSGAAGTGNGTVAFTVGSGGARSGTISVAGQTFTVTQGAASCGYSIAPASQSIPAAGGTVDVAVTAAASCAWSSSSNADWITIAAGASGNGGGSVRLNVAANTGPARTGTATIAGQTFTVTQAAAPCNYSLNPAVVDIPHAGNTGSTSVTTGPGCTWTAVSGSSWIAVSAGTTSGSGPGTVGFTVAANSGAARSGSITIGGQTLTVNQQAAPCAYTINPSGQTLGSDAGGGSVAVTAAPGCAWTAASDNDWLVIAAGAESGNGNGSVPFTVAANTTGAVRTGTMTIAGHTFTLTQEAPCAFTLSAAGQQSPPGGGAGSVTVTTATTCGWTAASQATWLIITGGASGTGSGTVNFTVEANTGTTRTGTITIANQVYTVEQLAP